MIGLHCSFLLSLFYYYWPIIVNVVINITVIIFINIVTVTH